MGCVLFDWAVDCMITGLGAATLHDDWFGLGAARLPDDWVGSCQAA